MHPSNIMWYLNDFDCNSDVSVNVIRSKHFDGLANALGIPDIYENVENPYKHLELASRQGGTRENFFETTVTAYDQAGSLQGWDEV